MDKKIEAMGKEGIGKLLIKFSLPAMIGMVVNALYNVIDRIFVGRGVDALAIAGVTMSFPFMIFILALSMLIAIGATTQVSIKLGERNKDMAEKVAGNALTLSIITSIIVTVLGLLFLEPFLRLFGANGQVLEYAKQFTFIMFLGVIFQIVAFTMNSILRGEGNPKMAMITLLVGSILNIILNPIFIFVFKWGIKGSAIATLISQLVSCIWVLSYFFSKKSVLRIKKENLKLDLNIVKTIAVLGLPPFMMQGVTSILLIIFNRQLTLFGGGGMEGDLSVAAMGIINGIIMLIMMPIFGLSQGFQPIAGYNFGAKRPDRIKRAFKLAVIVATTICTIGFLWIMIFAQQVIGMFNTSSPELIVIGTKGLRIVASMLPLIGFMVIATGYFQAVGKYKHAMFLGLLRQVMILIPMLLILPNFFGTNGVWIAGPISDFIAFLFILGFIIVEMRNLDKEIAEYGDLRKVQEIKS